MNTPSSTPKTWKEAWEQTPGPQSLSEAITLSLKGACMGTADIIPGVSGGTVAFITGIYHQLLQAIASFNLSFFQLFFTLRWKEAFAAAHFRFLIPLMIGIFAAVISTARLMHYLITEHSILTWSTFMGLIIASIWVVSKQIPKEQLSNWFWVAAGAIGAYFLVGVIPVQTPETAWFVFLCGMIAICAMILPGISGSFFLLILGKYAYITNAIKNPFSIDHLTILCIFAAGCALGLMGFSRVLNYFFKNHYGPTVALLTGMMIGALRKVWPWKEVLETQIIRGKTHVLREQNILPAEINSQVVTAFVLMLVGFIAVWFIERQASGDLKPALKS